MIYTYTCSSPLGEITMAANDCALTGLWFVGQKYYADILKGEYVQDLSEDGRAVGHTADRASGRTVDRTADRAAGRTENVPQIFRQTSRWLDIYFSGKEPDFMPEICLSGSPFQLEVWEILRTVPYGQTITYGEIAAQIAGRRGTGRMSAQAVGGAVGRNPVSILVPCHRVVGKNGNLTGYAGGINRKTSLLKLEGVDMASLFQPRHEMRLVELAFPGNT